MGAKKDDKLDDLKKNFNIIDGSFKSQKDPSSHFESIETDFSNILSNKFADEESETYFKEEMLPKWIASLLRRGDFSRPVSLRVHAFLQNCIYFIIDTLPSGIDPLLGALFLLLNNQSVFYQKHLVGPMDGEELENLHTDVLEDTIKPEALKTSGFCFRSVYAFISHHGLQRCIDRINDQDRLSLVGTRHILKSVAKILHYLKQEPLTSFYDQVKPTVFESVLSLNDEELKGETVRTLSEICEVMRDLTWYAHRASPSHAQPMEQFILDVAYKCFVSPYLDKRVHGLTEIKEMFIQIAKKEEKPTTSSFRVPIWMNAQYLVNFIKEKQIMEQLYGGLNIELMKRATDILKYMAQFHLLDRKYLDLMWEASQGKHEAIVHVIYTTATGIADSLSIEDIDYLFEKFKAIPYSQYDMQTIVMVRSFSVTGINQTSFPMKKGWYGLPIFWALIQENAGVPTDIAMFANNTLWEFLNWPPCHAERSTYLEKCVENIRNGDSVILTQQLMNKIIGSYESDKETVGMDDTPESVIAWLEKEFDLLRLILQELTKYKEHALSVSRTMDPSVDPNNVYFRAGPWTHYAAVQHRLSFLEFVLAHNHRLQLTKDLLDSMWTALVTNALTDAERDLAFGWLENMLAKTQMTEEGMREIFLVKVSQLDFSRLSPSFVSFWDFYFRRINWMEEKFMQDANHFVIHSFDLTGLDNLWRIILEAQDPGVGKTAIDLLHSLNKNFDQNLRPFVESQRRGFIDRCMQYLTEGTKNYPNISPRDELKCNRCLQLLSTFLDEFESRKSGPRDPTEKQVTVQWRQQAPASNVTRELQMYPSDTIQSMRDKIMEALKTTEPIRFIMNGRELKNDSATLAEEKVPGSVVNVIKRMGVSNVPNSKVSLTELDPSILPSTLLSQQEYFDQLFGLLNMEFLAQRVWDLLSLLPTNQKIQNEISGIRDSQAPSWERLLPMNSTFKQLYSLQRIEELLYPFSSDSESEKLEKENYRRKFVELGGLTHLFNLLLGANLAEFSQGSKRKECYALLIRTINLFSVVPAVLAPDTTLLTNPPKLDTEMVPVELKSVLLKLMEMIWSCAKSAPIFPPIVETTNSPLPNEEAKVVGYAIRLFVATTTVNSDMLNALLTYANLESWVSDVILTCLDKKIRKEVGDALYCLCKTDTQGLASQRFLTMLQSFIPRMQPTFFTTEQYFEFLNRLLQDACKVDASPYHSLLETLVQLIKDHPILEVRNGVQDDVVLTGYLNLVATLISTDPKTKLAIGSQGGFINEIYDTCLFQIPTAHNHSTVAPPKCKSKMSRTAAFNLLVELCRGCPENLLDIQQKLHSQHSEEGKPALWSYLPSAYEKSPTGYVGLKNLGATCYMNSLLQQFYMIPKFRSGLISVPIEEMESMSLKDVPEQDRDKQFFERLQDNALYQIQDILSNLQETEKKYYDTRDFCQAYKPDGQPVNTFIQMDANEFLVMLFDKMESLLKGTKEEKILNQFFGGVLCNQIISKECEHVSEREEGCFTLSLEIKNKRNIQESLELYIQGDPLEGDNKYFCGTCSRHVNAVRRCCIQTLPDNLIVHAKRFEFDFNELKRVKVNDYCEFPMTLNMEPFTKEGLAKVENPNAQNLPSHPPGYYQYELAGVLVHIGTADSGHYYSYIREREPSGSDGVKRWYQFNDTDVEPFDPKEIVNACFGGLEQSNVWEQGKYVSKMVEKAYNGYMLFYERVGQDAPSPSSDAMVIDTPNRPAIPPRIFDKIWRENQTFLNEKHVFDPIYFKFVWNIVKLESSDPVLDYTDPDFSHPAMRSLVLGTKFIFNTLCHAKERGDLREDVNYLKDLYSRYVPGAKWFLEIILRDPNWLSQTLIKCTLLETREIMARFFYHVLSVIAPHERSYYLEEIIEEESMEIIKKPKQETDSPLAPKLKGVPKSLAARFIDLMMTLLPEAAIHWKNNSQFFFPLREFANLGNAEKEFLIHRKAVAQILDFYLADDSPYAKKSSAKRRKMGDKFNNPTLGYMVDFITVMVKSGPHLADVVEGKEHPLTLATEDYELLNNWKVYQRLMDENINVKSMLEFAKHCCYENLALSADITDAATQGINKVHQDKFEPYFRVLTEIMDIQDSQRTERVDAAMDAYRKVITENVNYPTATKLCIKYLVDTNNQDVRLWLYSHLEKWCIGAWMYQTGYDGRIMVLNLVETLIPEYPHFTMSGPAVMSVPIEFSDEFLGRFHRIFRHLLNIGKLSRMYWKLADDSMKVLDDPTAWKCAHYFRFVRWLTFSIDQKRIFTEFSGDFLSVLLASDQHRLSFDENKKELVLLLNHMITDCPENVVALANDDKVYNKLLEHYITISPQHSDYNSEALPPFYSLVLAFVKENPRLLEDVKFHKCFEWAITTVYSNPASPEAADIIFEILKMCCQDPKFREKQIPLTVESNKMIVAPGNLLRFLDLLLASVEDIVIFCKRGGVQALSDCIVRLRDELTIVSNLRMAFKLFLRVTEWMSKEASLPSELFSLRHNLLQDTEYLVKLPVGIAAQVSKLEVSAHRDVVALGFRIVLLVCHLVPSVIPKVFQMQRDAIDPRSSRFAVSRLPMEEVCGFTLDLAQELFSSSVRLFGNPRELNDDIIDLVYLVAAGPFISGPLGTRSLHVVRLIAESLQGPPTMHDPNLQKMVMKILDPEFWILDQPENFEDALVVVPPVLERMDPSVVSPIKSAIQQRFDLVIGEFQSGNGDVTQLIRSTRALRLVSKPVEMAQHHERLDALEATIRSRDPSHELLGVISQLRQL
eukprot:TRINITY_DN4142_c0_g1_i2.p1 TRINITY_DN4142_c0_g1~~TRINITY_DN4142_c0_g1_i2.p1  ORF type:complete len:2758 (-),score=812.11 TRINITY_DN4142_c0_g1_i2:29-8302(-)